MPAHLGPDDAVQPVAIVRWDGDRPAATADAVAREEPLEIQLGGTSLLVTMRTPGHDEELALGFLVSEGVIRDAADVAAVAHATVVARPEAEDNVVRVLLRPGVTVDAARLRRTTYASASCGLCGTATIEQTLRDVPALADDARVPAATLLSLPSRLHAAQAAFARTGGLHAAGLFTADGALVAVREDIGRHNAVDKLVGWALRAGRLPLAGHALLVSGRVSYEIAQKAIAARVPVLAGVSAPSSLAVALAERAGLTLVGFLRAASFNVYACGARIAA